MSFIKFCTTRIHGLTVETVTVLLTLREMPSEKAKYCREFYSEYKEHTPLMQAFSFNKAISHLVYFTQIHYQNRINFMLTIKVTGTPATNLPEEHRSLSLFLTFGTISQLDPVISSTSGKAETY